MDVARVVPEDDGEGGEESGAGEPADGDAPESDES